MRGEIASLIDKAERSLDAARDLQQKGYSSFAASRAYYAMFYAAEAVLLTKDLAFSKHSGVISAFGEHFIKTKLLPKELHAYLREAFDKRTKGDYGLEELPGEDADQTIKRADAFLQQVVIFISSTK